MISRFTTLVVLLIAGVVLFGPAHSFAQSTGGTILGRVTDRSDAVIGGAVVKVQNVATGAVRAITTSPSGEYSATQLLPGNYQVTAEQAGFKRFVRTSIVLETAGIVRVDVALEVGDTANEVTVTAAVPAIETDTGRIGTIQSQALYQFAPVAANRGVFNHLVLSPGTVVNSQSTYSINGSRGYSSGFQIDGTNTGTPTNGAQESSQTPNLDYLQESRIDSVSNSAEFAHAGNFAMTTKSGTNELHGSAEYTIDASALAARSYFSGTKPVYRSHYFHGYLSGPLVIPRLYDGHNRTFFLLGYDGQTLPNEALLTPNVPSAAMRGGDFSRLFGTGGALTVIKDPLTGVPFANNTIPSARLSPQALKFQQMFYPQPNWGSADSIAANYRGTVSTNDTVAANMVARIDHQFTQNNRTFVRFYRNVGNFKRNDGQLPAMGRFRRIRFNHSWTVANTHVFSPTVINEFRLGGYSKRWPINSGYLGKSVIDAVGLTGYPGAIDPNVNGAPVVNITGFTSIAATTTSLERLFNLDLNDSVTWIRGAHTLKFGFNGMHTRQNSYPTSPSGSLGTFDFTGFATNYALADFLLGIPRDSIRSGIVPAFNNRNYEYGGYVQDDWKLSSRLTLNFGLRYEFHQPFRDRDNRLANFDPVSGSIVIPTEAVRAFIAPNYPTNISIITADKAGFPTQRLMAGDKGDWAPRFGFAYRVDNTSTTVIRGGFGIYYDAQARKAFSGLTSGPFVASQTFDNTVTNNVPLYMWPQAFPVASSRALGVQSVTAANPWLKDAYTQQWNLTVERALPLAVGLRASYIGFQAHQLPYRRNLNQPAPSTVTFTATRRPYQAFNTITYTDSGANQSYNALQFEANRRMIGGLALNAHYTWAKNLTDSLDNNALGAVIQNQFDRAAERGNEVYTARHRFMVNFVYDIPVGKGRSYLSSINPILDKAIGGWTISGLGFWRTGYWTSASFSGSDPSNTGQTGGRPDTIRNPNLPADQRTLARWFDTTAFALPPNGRFGNAGVNTIETPGAGTFGMGINKYFPIYERLRARLSLNARNVFNHPTLFGNPATNISSPGQVGQITGYQVALEENPYRSMYGMLRFEW